MNSPGKMGVRGVVIALVLVGGLLPALGTARADPVLSQDVLFGVPRTELAPGLDFEAACAVTASYQGVAMLDGESDSTFLAVSPGSCDIAVYILGIRIAVPLADETPLGRTSYYLPGIGGITFGLADVSIDLVTGLRAEYTGDASTVNVSPGTSDWDQWGVVHPTVTAHSGQRGSVLSTTAPHTLSFTFGVGVSVYFLGFRLYSWDETLAAVPGSPRIDIPVTIDLMPNSATLTTATAPSPYSLQVAWTRSSDSDFAAYEISVESGASRHVYLVEDPAETTLTIPAAATTRYTVQVIVIDRAGQKASSDSRTVATPSPPQLSPEKIVLQSPISYVVLGVAFAGGVGLGWKGRGRRERAFRLRGSDSLGSGGVRALPPAPPLDAIEPEEAGVQDMEAEVFESASGFVSESKIAMLRSAYESGRISQEVYLTNLRKMQPSN